MGAEGTLQHHHPPAALGDLLHHPGTDLISHTFFFFFSLRFPTQPVPLQTALMSAP